MNKKINALLAISILIGLNAMIIGVDAQTQSGSLVDDYIAASLSGKSSWDLSSIYSIAAGPQAARNTWTTASAPQSSNSTKNATQVNQLVTSATPVPIASAAISGTESTTKSLVDDYIAASLSGKSSWDLSGIYSTAAGPQAARNVWSSSPNKGVLNS